MASNSSFRYTVSQLNRLSKDALADYFNCSIEVEGELSNLSMPSSGHIYFSLKDKVAQVRCAWFKSQQRGVAFKLKNGQHLIVSARVSLYEARGDYQLLVSGVKLGGAGDLQKAFEQLKEKLRKEGLFDAKQKQGLPKIPKRIGIITSSSGAALHDILSVLNKRFPSIPVIIYPAAVQGENAKVELVRALEVANQQAQADLLILARGGGSLEDLWAFNEEVVARAMASSKLPIICAVGHEVDFTIADFVADLRAATPSAAAESAVPDQQEWLHKFHSIEVQLRKIMQQQLFNLQQSIRWKIKRLQQQHPAQQLQKHAQTLDSQELQLVRSINAQINGYKTQLENQRRLLQRCNPSNKIAQQQQQLRVLHGRLVANIEHQLKAVRSQYIAATQMLASVNPLAVLARGYAIVTAADATPAITSSQQLKVNDWIKTRLHQGHIISQVTKIEHE